MEIRRLFSNNADDEKYLNHAINIAWQGVGLTGINPSVGCVIVKNSKIIAVARTADKGRPHAEYLALEQAGEKAKNATAYVTLEPCAHEGETPSCAKILSEAGISRVVYCMQDPDPRTAGQGAEILRSNGLEVTFMPSQSASELYKGFASKITFAIPEINLKTATSLDGFIANANGDSKWITSEQARLYGHKIRSQHDAIITGIATVLKDDPELTCRIKGLEQASPIRVVMDRNGRLPKNSKLAMSAKQTPTLLFCSDIEASKKQALTNSGVEIIIEQDINLHKVAAHLTKRGISRALVEAGHELSSHALNSGLINLIYWFRAPKILGRGGLSPFSFNENIAPDQITPLEMVNHKKLEHDILEIYRYRDHNIRQATG